jgi:hypothetical protein
MNDQVTIDPFDMFNDLLRGNGMAMENVDPQYQVNDCLLDDFEYMEGGMSFKYGGSATGLANCTPTPFPEHLCNGNYEQYDGVLNYPGPLSNNIYNAPFTYNNMQVLQPGTGAFANQSDIINWYAPTPSVVGATNSAFVHIRNGVGGRPVPMSDIQFNFFNNTGFTFTWPTLTSDAMIALRTRRNGSITGSGTVRTEIGTLMTNAYNAYEFSFKYLVSNVWSSYLPNTPAPKPQLVKFILKGAGVPDVAINGGMQVLPVFTLQSPQGWVTETYIIPTTSLGANPSAYTHIEIETFVHGAPEGNFDQAIWFDDVSLKPACQGSDFPQSISLAPKTGTLQPGTYTDIKSGNQFIVSAPTPFILENHHHSERFIETDAQGNTYVAAYVNYDDGNPFVQNLMHPELTYSANPNQVRELWAWSGILLSKYNRCGELEWQETIHNRHNTNLAGLAVSPNGNVYVLGNAESNGQIWQFLQTSSSGASSPSTTPGKRVFVAEFNTNGLCTDIVEAAVSNNRHAVDIEYYNGDFKVITTNSNANSIEVLENDPLNNVLAPAFLITNRTALKSTVNANGELYIATAALNAIDIKRVNFNTGATISTSALITQDANRPSFGFPTQTVNDILCDNNGNVFLLGNFSNGLSFIGGTPTNSVTSVYQNYANTGIGVTGFIAKYTAGLGYVKSDFLAPEILPGQMVQIPDPNNPPTFSCAPPAAGACDVVTAFQNPSCTPGGIGYVCVNLIWTNPGPYANTDMFGSISIDANNNVLISGIVSNGQWGTGQLIQTNAQPFVCKYDNNLNRAWFNETQGAIGVENGIVGHTTGIAFEPVNGQHRVVGNFIGNVKLFDNSTLNTATTNEHIFVTNLIDIGGSAIFKNEGDMNDAVNEVAAFTVYPNPANTMVTIEGTEAGFDYVLSNSFGQVIQTGHTASNVTEVEVSDLSAGVYMLSLQGSKNETIRLVITR